MVEGCVELAGELVCASEDIVPLDPEVEPVEPEVALDDPEADPAPPEVLSLPELIEPDEEVPAALPDVLVSSCRSEGLDVPEGVVVPELVPEVLIELSDPD